MEMISPAQEKRITELSSHLHGLSTQEAKKRIDTYGLNLVSESKKQNFFVSFLSRFKNPLIIILLFASFISASTGAIVDFIIITAIVFFSVIIDFIQEYQSEQAAEKLKQKATTHVWVMRDGEKKEITASHVTKGDLVMLSSGDVVPADMEIITADDFHVDESTLTGESFPVEKGAGQEIMMGSTVLNGDATGVIVRIGSETEFGKIAHTLSLKRPETDFEKGIRHFGMLVMQLTLTLVIFIFFVNIIFKHDLFNSFLFAIALAVGLTPELLPMIVTVNLSKGAMRMAKKGVIVKHLPSIQNFGSMNILCTDKTGTITENKIRLEKYENILGEEDAKVLKYAFLNSSFQSNLRSPLDEAILAHSEAKSHEFKKVDEIPFDFIRKRLSVVVRNSEYMLICKGAPESVWSVTSHYYDGQGVKKITKDIQQTLAKRFKELSTEGFRVLAVAYKIVPNKKTEFTKDDENNLIFLGYTAFLDPPKESAKEVLQSLHTSGVTLKILTGDNELVTQKVCRELDIPVSGVVVATQLLHVTERALQRIAINNTIFARLTPDQKDRIILALKKANNVVGYLGDGVNDAPSLRAADIGISVENAVDVAKDSADIILVTKSLHVLQEGIIEGRKTFVNTMKYIFMGMGSNFGNMFSVSIASLIMPFLPLLPIQILLNNLMYDVSQLSLPTDNVDMEEIKKPLRWDINFIKHFIFTFGPISSLFDFITFVGLLYIFRYSVPAFRTGWFIESLVTQSLIILAVRTKTVPFFKSKPSVYVIWGAIGAAIASIVISQTQLGIIFQFVKLPGTYWVFLIIVVILYIMVVETAKKIFYTQLNVRR